MPLHALLAAASLASCNPDASACCQHARAATPTHAVAYNIQYSKSLTLHHPFRSGVDDVRRPGFNGLPWTTDPNSHASLPTGDPRSPGANAYGAPAATSNIILFRHWPHALAIDPFERVDAPSLPLHVQRKAEEFRNAWLKDHGYTGGVRTFTNDAAKPSKSSSSTPIQPRGVIELNPEVTKFKSRMEVRRSKALPKTNTQAPTFASTDQPANTTLASTTTHQPKRAPYVRVRPATQAEQTARDASAPSPASLVTSRDSQ